MVSVCTEHWIFVCGVAGTDCEITNAAGTAATTLTAITAPLHQAIICIYANMTALAAPEGPDPY